MTSAKKHYGVVYTPTAVVDLMLDKLPSLKAVAVCDPACGDGRFLVALAERLCGKMRRARSAAARRAYARTLRGLTGLELDAAALRVCRARLDAVARQYGVGKIQWNLRRVDAIERASWHDMTAAFDYVIGNPPYVRVQHLEAQRRARINRGAWRLMTGCTDLFILFFEMGLELLRQNGRLVFITPNTWMKSASGAALRRHLRERCEIVSITDFGGHQVFAEATTYTAISEIRKLGAGKRGDNAGARAAKCVGFDGDKPRFAPGRIDTNERHWSVLSEPEFAFIRRIRARPTVLADVADIHVGIQTLADEVFILPRREADGIEPGITRKIYKASVMRGGKDAIERIAIYPYRAGALITEAELRESYPRAYAYLRRRKARLLRRDKGRSRAAWYGYGREVSILSAFGKKILTAALNPAPDFQLCPDPHALFYAGYCVKPKPGVSFPALLAELNSPEMARYIRLVSRPYQGGWYSYAKAYIRSFPLMEKVYVDHD